MFRFASTALAAVSLLIATYCLAAGLQEEERMLDALRDNEPTKDELRLLPDYCEIHPNLDAAGSFASDKAESPERKKWEAFFGNSFPHMHHYCWALNWINRAHKSEVQENRDAYYETAIGDLQYIISRADPSMALLPEIYVQMGLLLIQRNKHSEAVKAYLDAIQTMPTYVPAYSALSDYYCELGNVEEARNILSRGLQQVPGSKILKRRISEVESSCKSEVR